MLQECKYVPRHLCYHHHWQDCSQVKAVGRWVCCGSALQTAPRRHFILQHQSRSSLHSGASCSIAQLNLFRSLECQLNCFFCCNFLLFINFSGLSKKFINFLSVRGPQRVFTFRFRLFTPQNMNWKFPKTRQVGHQTSILLYGKL